MRKVRETLRGISMQECVLALYQCVIVTLWTQVLVWGSVIRTGWWTTIHYVRAGACERVSLHVSICDCAAALVSVVRRVSQPGESAGLALVMLTEGRHFRGSRTPWHQSPQSPRQTGSIWALSAPLAPADSDLYDGGERSGLDQGEGKYEPDSSALCEMHALPVSMLHVWLH